MGFKQSLICPICNYETFTSGGPDRGFNTWKNTFVCLDCNTINDLVIERPDFKQNIKLGFRESKINKDQNCHECGGKSFALWDSKNKPCPKCGTKLKIDPHGMSMNWD